MQLLTFLGTGRYQKTCYTWQDKEVETPYVAEALSEFLQPEKVTVLVTKEAKEAHWENLHQALANRFSATEVLIPSGKSEAEVWQIFDAVVSAVEPDSKVLFDITHAFRSIPMLVLLASAFLQKARNVEISGVYYGAFDVNRDRPPIFELTPAIKLLEWLTATDKFLSTGSSEELGKLLSTIQGDFYRAGKQKGAELKPTKLKSFGDRIQGLSRSIELLRPVDLMEEAAKLQNISSTELENEVGAFAKPFQLLLSQIQQDYSQFALGESQESNVREQLQKQFLLLRWYAAKKQSAQAILLAREWLISALCIAEGIDDYRDTEKRKPVEHQLGKTIAANPEVQPIFRHVTDEKKLSAFWSTLTEYRNDIAHAQMRRTNIPATTLQGYVENKLIRELEELLPEYVA